MSFTLEGYPEQNEIDTLHRMIENKIDVHETSDERNIYRVFLEVLAFNGWCDGNIESLITNYVRYKHDSVFNSMVDDYFYSILAACFSLD
jgi:hypothetical protein